MATETKEKTDGNQISNISSIFSDTKTKLNDFRQGLPDYIEKIISKKLVEQYDISLHANPTNIDEDSCRVNSYGDTETPVQNNRNKSFYNIYADQSSAVGGSLKRIQMPQ